MTKKTSRSRSKPRSEIGIEAACVLRIDVNRPN